MTILIISEKPSAARKIASALSNGKAKSKGAGKVKYHEFSLDGQTVQVAASVGHIYGIHALQKGNDYPVFDIAWGPSHEIEKNAAYTKEYLNVLRQLAKGADEVVNACDYDFEGELIGAKIIEFNAPAKKKTRMKFSTLTAKELQTAFNNRGPPNAGLAEAGETRHELDWLWGINGSRALTAAIKKAGIFRILSIGRVQGPALAVLAQRERDIKAFISKPFWQLLAQVQNATFEHGHGKFWEEKEADDALKNSDKNGSVKSVQERKVKQRPPPPFDLTSLQLEAYRCFGFTPTQTLQLAQDLYSEAYLSYPRTASQKLPKTLGLEAIIRSLSKQPAYQKSAQSLVDQKRFVPVEGKKEDPAHPAIHPTGEMPSKLNPLQQKLYDLVTKRFLSCFAEEAKRIKMHVVLTLGKEDYQADGVATVHPGWHAVYAPYTKIEETILPPFKEGQAVTAEDIAKVRKDTQPPKRFTQASVIKALESKGLGTKCIAGFEPIHVLNNHQPKQITLKELVGHVQDKKTNPFLVFSLDNNQQIIKKKIASVSSRPLGENEKMLNIQTDYFSLCTTDLHDVFVYKRGLITNKKARDLETTDNVVSRRSLLSSAKSRLLGHLVGDCSLSIRKDIKKLTADIRYHNKNLELIEQFVRIVEKEYGVKLKIRRASRNRFYVSVSLPLSTRLLRETPEIQKKQVKFERIDSPASFAAALIDDKGCIFTEAKKDITIKGIKTRSHGIPKIKVTMKTRQTLVTLQRCLKTLNIESKIYASKIKYKRIPRRFWTLYIGGRRNLERFALRVPLRSSRKIKTLLRGLLAYPTVRKKAKLLSLLDANWSRLTERKKRITSATLINLARELKEDGVVEIRRQTIRNKKNTNNTTIIEVRLEQPFVDTIYAHLNDQALSFDLFSKKIKKIEIAPYRGDVYDLEISPDTPQYFIGKGNFLVHNSTRAQIVQTLYNRNYVAGKRIEVTPLGLRVHEALERHVPEILSEAFTRHLEEEMEAIESGKTSKEKVVSDGKTELTKMLSTFKKKELDVGKELVSALKATQFQANVLGVCKHCGKDLVVRKSKYGFFVGCLGYPACKTVYPLPKGASVKALKKVCQECGTPQVSVHRKAKKTFTMCLDPNCKTKANWGKPRETAGSKPTAAKETS